MFRSLASAFLLPLSFVSTTALATHWVVCDSPHPAEGVKNILVQWLEGSLGPVGPIQIQVESETKTKIIFYTVSEHYPGYPLKNVGYFSDDQEIRLKLMDENYISDRILLKYNRVNESEGTGYVSISDPTSNLMFSKIKLSRCETL